MGPIDESLELYLFLRDNVGWHSQLDIADKLNLAYFSAGCHLAKLNKHGLIRWVEIGVDKYFFVPCPATGGSHTYLTELIEKMGRVASFERLGKITGHGPRTLEEMIKSLKRFKELGFYKKLNLNIEIPRYTTDEPVE